MKSMNKNIDLVIDAISYFGMTSYGKIMVGDNAFEYYNNKNVNDYIQIPWSEIEYISASVIFNKRITRFAIFTKRNGNFSFSTKDNIKTLKVVKKYINSSKILKSPTFFKTIIKGIKNLFRKN